MTDRIRVRLVPKAKDEEAVTLDLGEVTPQTAKRYAPDLGRAGIAMRSALNLGLESRVSRHNSVDTLVPQDKLSALFSVDLTEKKRKVNEFNVRSQSAESFVSTDRELGVPDDMKDTVAYAYIPSPPEFFAPTPIAPKITLYHLSLMDVVTALEASHCHRRGWTGQRIRVAMTDTGFAPHPFFDLRGFNITRAHTPETAHPMVDTSGHGTGESANVLMVAPDVYFIGVKHDDYSALALETALDQNPHIVTNSWGWDIDHVSRQQLRQLDPNLFNEMRDVENIINDAIDDGVTMVFSAGNGHRAFPGCMPEVISVGGATVNADGSLAASTYASSFRSLLYPGRQVPDFCGVVGEYAQNRPMPGHIMLPVPSDCELEGENMPNAQSRRGWGVFSGTSAAAPQIAGVAALLLSVNRNLSPADIKTLMAATTKDVVRGQSGLGDQARTGHDYATGAGFVNAQNACEFTERVFGRG